jgi:UDP-N-acetylmuramoyl-tripeptide--D-alanyl-D-alanine ligase
MKPLTLEEIIQAIGGTVDRSIPGGSVKRVTIDSRDVQSGDLFMAICGERFDGHDFVGEAMNAGAAAAVVAMDYEPPAPTTPRARHMRLPDDALLIRVDNTVTALGRLGHYHRRSAMGGSMTVIAVTGSNGKTTTKTMIAHVLNGRWPGRAAIKSYNNEIGVPLTLLAAEPSDRFVVCEVGTNAPGEIGSLSAMIEPDIAVITGIGPAHLERLGSIENIAVEKLSLLRHLKPDGCALVNIDNEILHDRLQKDRSLAALKIVTFGQSPDADLRITDLSTEDDLAVRFVVNQRFSYRLNLVGRHNALNALAAIGVGRRLGMQDDEIAARLISFAPPPMRLQVEQSGELTIINDAYNANPASLAAALEVLSDIPAPNRRVVIVGDMKELGSLAEELHAEAAQQIAHQQIDVVLAVGEYARLITSSVRQMNGDIETHAYASTSLAKKRLVSHLRPDDTVLVKGSRAMALEQLIEAMKQWSVAETREPKEDTSPRRVSA